MQGFQYQDEVFMTLAGLTQVSALAIISVAS